MDVGTHPYRQPPKLLPASPEVRGWNANTVHPDIMGNRRAALAAVTDGSPIAFFRVADELRGDKGIVLAAVARRGNTLKLASAQLRADREVSGRLKYTLSAKTFTSKDVSSVFQNAP